ncbi:Haloacid dehalogenase-like hydrolase domain-containing protein 3 [Vanrija pseudolonga]|uniref:Haloacid dehalogenase-like hydrolase domain-containing protein 3 n=1 Tax=Vanrija pseudolonga TaxID=143232 RepID=A0AAF0Y9I8_9TREE|nr:Haloacid dehalogenase-like hydrolase domain-containing protein 3 [Vanrija pseudolonga]
MPRPPVRLVLFDVFDTLVTPRLPVHDQYAAEAVRLGLRVTPAGVKAGFRPAFKEMNAQYPLYGKHSVPPLTPEKWWSTLIHKCMVHAGAGASEVDQKGSELAAALLKRFESEVGYRAFEDTMPTLRGLRELGIKTSVVSNADPRINLTLTALGIEDLLSFPPTLSWDVEASKPDREIFARACDACGEAMGEGVIMVGDELEADFGGATGAGIEGRLIRRSGEWSEGAIREAEEDLGSVNVVHSLEEVLAEARARQGA